MYKVDGVFRELQVIQYGWGMGCRKEEDLKLEVAMPGRTLCAMAGSLGFILKAFERDCHQLVLAVREKERNQRDSQGLIF